MTHSRQTNKQTNKQAYTDEVIICYEQLKAGNKVPLLAIMFKIKVIMKIETCLNLLLLNFTNLFSKWKLILKKIEDLEDCKLLYILNAFF